MSVLRSRYLSTGLLLITLFVFAAQCGTIQTPPSDAKAFLAPLVILSAVTGALLSAQAFPRQPVSAAVVSGSAVCAFLYGEAFCSAALDGMFRSPIPWWNENVVATLVIFAMPSTLATAIGAFILSRQFAKGTS